MVVVRKARSAAGVDVWVAVLAALALVVSLGIAAVADGERPAAGVVVDDCGSPTVVQAAKTAGFECTQLFNKGTPGQVLGRLFVRLHEGVVTVAVDTGSTAPLSGVKLCIDDDPVPRENVPRVSCLGGTAGATVNRSYTIGTQVRLANDPKFEEADGKYEYMLEGGALPLKSGGTTFPGSGTTTFGPFVTYTARVGLTTGPVYEDFSFHFNQSSKSIESFFNLTPSASVTLTCEPDTTLGGGDQPTYTVQIQGPPCTKQVLFDAGLLDDGTTQFVDLRPATDNEPTLLFLEDIRWLPVAGGAAPRQLFYDDTPANGIDPELMPTCLQDPRRLDGDVRAFDIRDDLTVATATSVLPGGHTSCLVEASVRLDGGEVFTRHIVFNVGDGLRFH